jgi:uncharacterized repeat protein (TIGR01451 family)
MKTKTTRLLAFLLAVITITGVFPLSAFAAEPAAPGTTTDRYINEADGHEIATPLTVPAKEVKTPQTIVGYEYKSYSDVTDHIYAKEDLTYILGYPDKTVRGERALSRSEAAAIFYRLYDGFYPKLRRQMTSTTFSDIPQNAWYYKEAELCYNVGIINGYADGTFRPDEPITRAEFAIIAALAAELPNSDKQMFKDVNKDHWAYLVINSAAEAGWVRGYGDGTYRPEANISRAEAVTLINRMRNRAITVDKLKNLGIENPYTDLVETFWAYTDLMEATVKHAATDWHDLTYNDGKLNIIVEKYVDANGKEISEPTVTQGKVNYAARQFDRHYYLGYITTITYVYSDGSAHIVGAKSVDKTTAKVGDTLTYTITVGNTETATANLENAVMTDAISEYLDFIHGSVQVDGATVQYSFDNKTKQLTVKLGDIAAGQTRTITFNATVSASAYGKTVNNTAAISADNDKDKTVTDNGVTVADGTAHMLATKSVDKSAAKVGDTLIYTVTASNEGSSTVNLKNAVMNDVISEYLSFTHGSVQVDGYTARYSYDNATRQLSVELGDIAPGQTKTITFTAAINSTAYGKSFTNTAVLSADNDGDKTATDGGVTIADGTAEGSVGTKTVSSPTAKVGDTLTYTITLRNASTATAAWKNVKVSDVIPEYLSFVSGSVEENGRASSNASYNAGTKTLTLFADSINPGETVTFTFKATVQDGAQGRYIVNTAIVSGDGREDIQLPDTGVQIDAGNTAPYMTKTASVSEAKAGDIFTYTIYIKNGIDATAAWKNVVVSDVLPTGVKLVSGSVTLNGQTVSYGIFGQAIDVTAGDLRPGSDAVVTFDVRVLDSAEDTTMYNVAAAKGDNGQKSATDNGVAVPVPEDEDGGIDKPNAVTATKTVDKTLVNPGEKVIYTITAKNNTAERWAGVQVYDVLDTSIITLIDDSIYINGIRFLRGSGKWTFTDRQLVINLGDIEAGQFVKCEFQVQFKNDASNSTFVNHATLKGANQDSVYVKAPEVTIMNGGGSTDIHYCLFVGYGDGNGNPLYLWKPDTNITTTQICLLGYRLMTDFYRSSLGNGTVTVPDRITLREVQYFISHGVISASEYSAGADATQSQIYRVLNFALGANLSSNVSAGMSRASVASLICDLTGRDKSPNTNGLPVAYFSDKGSYAGLIDEVSNSHDYTMDSTGKETWISIIAD